MFHPGCNQLVRRETYKANKEMFLNTDFTINLIIIHIIRDAFNYNKITRVQEDVQNIKYTLATNS